MGSGAWARLSAGRSGWGSALVPWNAVSAFANCGRAVALGRLFDHLVGAGEEGGWDRQTDFLSGLQIDDQFEPSRLLDGQLGRFRLL